MTTTITIHDFTPDDIRNIEKDVEETRTRWMKEKNYPMFGPAENETLYALCMMACANTYFVKKHEELKKK